MKFLEFREVLKQHFDEMAENNTMLFEVDADKDELYELYLASYPSGTNNIFREKTEHDCSECRSFIKGIGLAVSIKDGVIESIWDFHTTDKNYQAVIDKMAAWVKQHPIKDVYLYDRKRVGVESNKEIDDNGKIWTWQHFYCDLPAQYFESLRTATEQTCSTVHSKLLPLTRQKRCLNLSRMVHFIAAMNGDHSLQPS